jgi:hypothetical protein
MKSFVFIIAAVLTSSLAQQAFSQGLPGAPTPEEQQLLLAGGTGKGGADVGKGGLDGQIPEKYWDLFGSNSSDTAMAACDGVATELRGAYGEAVSISNPFERRRLLKVGIDRALRLMNGSRDYQPITLRALRRASETNGLFTGACSFMRDEDSIESCLLFEAEAAIYALSRVYIWILGSVIPLDQDYYIPYQRDHKQYCNTFNCLPQTFRDPFVNAYSKSASSILDLYLGRSSDGSRLPEAFGKNLYRLRVAERVAKWAAEDLNQDLSRESFVCVIGGLLRTNSLLKEFNGGNRDYFRTEDRAKNFARGEIEKAADWLASSVECRRSPRGPWGSYRGPFQ